jgi:hypothetical protein
MASIESMAIRSNEALDRIETAVSELLGADVPTLQRVHRDRDMLRVVQLETIAQWLEEIQEAERSVLIEALPMVQEPVRTAHSTAYKPRRK